MSSVHLAKREAKRRSAAEVVAMLRPRDVLCVPLGPGQPGALLDALGARDDWEQLSIFCALLLAPHPVLFKPGVRVLSGFFGPVERALYAQGLDVHFIAADFRRYAPAMRKLSARVVATLAAPPDSEGRLSLALHAGASVEELHRAGRDPERLLVVEVNPALPRTFGIEPHSHCLHLDEIDVILESDAALPTISETPPSAVEIAIAGEIRRFVHDGMTLQTGIGAIPSSVVEILAASSGGDYGVHSEMFTTGLMKLHEAGKVTNRKGLHDGFSVATFAFGTAELHRWLDERQDVRFLPVELVNDPAIVARNRNMLSINGALAVDLYGQIAADSIGGKQWSGIGGAEDFVCGASFSDGGHSILCLPSTASVGGAVVSRIVSQFPAGALVTTPRHQVDVIVTEYGAAELAGLTVAERGQALAAIAHPDFRSELLEASKRR